MVKKSFILFFLFLFFILMHLLIAQRQSSVVVSTVASNSSSLLNYSFNFTVNSNIIANHCIFDERTKQIYYFRDAVVNKQTSFNGLYKIGVSRVSAIRTYSSCSLIEGDECGNNSPNSSFARLIFNRLLSFSENIGFNNLNSQVVASIGSDPQPSLTLVQTGTISQVVLERNFKDINNYNPLTNKINLSTVTWNDGSSNGLELLVDNPISVNINARKIYATHNVFSYQGTNNQITYNFQRKVVDRSLTFGINAQLVEIKSSDGTVVEPVNGNYVLLPGKTYSVKYKVRLSDNSNNIFDNNVSADFSLSVTGNGISISGSPLNDLYLTKTDKEITYQITTNNDFSSGGISLVVSDIRYRGDSFIFNDSNSQVSVQSNVVSVACGVDRIIPNSQTANYTALVISHVVKGSQYIEYYLNKVVGPDTVSVGRGTQTVLLTKDGSYSLEYKLLLRSDNNQFCNPSNKSVTVTVKLNVNNIQTADGGYVNYQSVQKTVQVDRTQEVTVTFTNFDIRANANATVSLELVSISGNDCTTPLVGNPNSVQIRNNRQLSQYVEYYLSNVRNSSHTMNVGKGVNIVTLQESGKYNFTYNFTLKSPNNNYCNNQNEPIIVRANLVVANVQSSDGGYIYAPQIQKEVSIRSDGKEYSLTFENIDIRANVEADVSLQISISQNKCDTPVVGAPNTIKLKLWKSLSQRVEYSMHEIKGPNEIINVPKGADTIALTTPGLKNITYNISFLTDNNFCNADSESITAVVELVNTSTTSSAGGYLKIPDNERQKTVVIKPRDVKKVTFNNIDFMPNVETILSLKLVSLTGNKCRTDFNGVSQNVKIIMNNPNLRQELEYYLKELKNSTETLQLGESVSEFNVPANGYYNVTYNITLTPKPYYCTDSNVVLKLKLNLTIVEQQGSGTATISNSISNELKLNSSANSVLVTFYNLYLHHNVTVRLRLEKIDFNGVCDTPLKGIPADEVILRRYQSDTTVTPPPPPTDNILSFIQNCLV
ncbi:MAG: hypothetical protein QXF76_01355 [Candidatus Anstonellales archaeon]